jgi:hypothetical protein
MICTITTQFYHILLINIWQTLIFKLKSTLIVIHLEIIILLLSLILNIVIILLLVLL